MPNYLLYLSLIVNVIFVILFFLQKGGIDYFKSKLGLRQHITFREHKPEYEMLSRLYKDMPRIPNSIVFVGNSLTRGCDWAEMFQNSRIRNRGIGGDCAEGVIERIGEILDPPPSKIFFELGLSDLARGYPPQEILQHYRTIIDTSRKASPSGKIYICSVLPVREGIPARHHFTNRDILELNKSLKNLALDERCTYINLHSHFLSTSGEIDSSLTVDGVHLNNNGYQKWRGIIEKMVAE
jgi:lysophospholipase L1-like esterase